MARRVGCRRALLGTALFGGGVLAAALVGAAGFAVWTTTKTGNAWLEGQLEAIVTASMAEGAFEIDGLRTNLRSRAQLDALRIVDGSGRPLLALGPTRARFDLASLITGGLVVHELDAVGLDVVLDADPTDPDGRMKLAALFGPPSTSTEPFELPIDLDLRDVDVEGVSVAMDDAVQVRAGVLTGQLVSEGPRFDVQGLQLCAHVLVPGPTSACIDGPVLWDGARATLAGTVVELPGTDASLAGTAGSEGLDLTLNAAALDLEAIDPVAAHVGLRGTVGGVLTASGPLDSLDIDGRIAGLPGEGEDPGTRGSLVLDGRAGVADDGTLTWGGAIDALGFRVDDVYTATGVPVLLDGAIGLSATGIRFPDDLALDLTYTGTATLDGQYELEDADVAGRIEGGVLTLERGAFVGLAGALDATGTIDLVEGPLGIAVKGRIDPAEIAELGIAGIGGSGTADLRITGDLKRDATRYGVRGQVVMAPLSYTENVRFERLVADVSGEVVQTDFYFDIDAVGTNGMAYGLEMDGLDAPGLRVTSVARDLAATGPAHVVRPRYPGVGVFEHADVEFEARLPAVGEQQVTAGVALGAFDLQTFPGSGGVATVELVGDQVAYDVVLDAWGREFAASTGTFDLQTASLDAARLRIAPTPRLAWTSEGPLRATFVDGGVRDLSATLRGLHGDLLASGDLGTRGVLDGEVQVAKLQLDALAELFPDQFSGLSGVADLQATLTGDASDPRAVGTLDVDGLWLEGVARWLDVAGAFSLEGGIVDTDLDIGSAGAPLADVDGTIPVLADLGGSPGLDPEREVALEAVLRPGSLERIENVYPEDLGIPEGSGSAWVGVSGRLANPTFRVSGVIETPVEGWQDPGRIEIDVQRDGDDITAWADLREGLAERTRVTGGGITRMEDLFTAFFAGEELPDTTDLELYVDNMAVSAVLAGLPADSVVRAAGLGVDARGEIVGGITASGSPWTPTLSGGLHWYDASVGNEPLDGAYITAVPHDSDGVDGPDGLMIDSAVGFTEGGLAVRGPIPVRIDLREEVATWTDGELALDVSGEGVPLGLLSVIDRQIVDAEGVLAVDGTIEGTLDRPIPKLSGAIVDGALTYTPVGLRVFEINGTLTAGERRVRLPELTARTMPINSVGILDQSRASRIRVLGTANIDAQRPILSARVQMDQAWVLGTFETTARVDGDLVVSGPWPELTITTPDGPLEVVSARVIYNSANAEVAGPVRLSDAIVLHRDGMSTRTERVEELPFYAPFTVDASVDLKRNVEVIAAVPFFDQLGSVTANLTRANVAARIGGRLNVALNDRGEPIPSGEVDVVDGSVQVLRTQFGLDEGRATFLGGDIGATQLDVSGSTTVEGTLVELSITGTADAPKLTTTAEGLDETQVLVMLLTGQSPDSLGGESGQAAQGEIGTIAGTAAALVASSVFSGAATGALTIEPDGGIRVGAPWSSTVLTELVLHPFADPDENLAAVGLEWAIARRLLLEFGAGTTFQWSSLSWETRF
jgi:hypothetical protein